MKVNNVSLFFKTNAKTGFNIENTFVTIMKHLYFSDYEQ